MGRSVVTPRGRSDLPPYRRNGAQCLSTLFPLRAPQMLRPCAGGAPKRFCGLPLVGGCLPAAILGPCGADVDRSQLTRASRRNWRQANQSVPPTSMSIGAAYMLCREGPGSAVGVVGRHGNTCHNGILCASESSPPWSTHLTSSEGVAASARRPPRVPGGAARVIRFALLSPPRENDTTEFDFSSNSCRLRYPPAGEAQLWVFGSRGRASFPQ